MKLKQLIEEKGPNWVDQNWEECMELHEKELKEAAKRRADYYESEGLDTSPTEEYRILKDIENHYIDLWL